MHQHCVLPLPAPARISSFLKVRPPHVVCRLGHRASEGSIIDMLTTGYLYIKVDYNLNTRLRLDNKKKTKNNII